MTLLWLKKIDIMFAVMDYVSQTCFMFLQVDFNSELEPIAIGKKVVLPKKLININVCIFSLTSKTASQKQEKACYFRHRCQQSE
ncbi:hypothetical protein LDENG_00232690 [Lucifuga dentata]|nr:hypothetical protein LDENG_00232690 [Lucifuga dentata]